MPGFFARSQGFNSGLEPTGSVARKIGGPMRHAVLSALMVSALAALGCDGESSATTGGPAGAVVELSGTATATRNGQARQLEIGAEVFGDDLIETDDGAELAIELRHNGARWSLSGGQKRRVDQSAAWRAEKQDESALAESDEDRTAAAGRHTEREAAQGSDTAVAESAVVVKDLPPAEREASSPGPPAPRPRVRSKRGGGKPSSSARRKKSAGIDDDLEGLALEVGSSGSGKRGSPAEDNASPPKVVVAYGRISPSGGIDAKTARRTLAGARAGLNQCARKSGATIGNATFRIRVSKGGKVAAIKSSGNGGAKFQACARTELRRHKFGEIDKDSTVELVIELSPAK